MRLSAVRSGVLLPSRRCRLLTQPPQWFRCAHQIRRLDSWDLLGTRDAGYQLDREIPTPGR